MKMNTVITSYHYTIQGHKINNEGSTFEDAFIVNDNYTIKQVIFLYTANSNCQYEADYARLEYIEHLTIDLSERSVIKVEREELNGNIEEIEMEV